LKAGIHGERGEKVGGLAVVDRFRYDDAFDESNGVEKSCEENSIDDNAIGGSDERSHRGGSFVSF
jgi:hypothetical protein